MKCRGIVFRMCLGIVVGWPLGLMSGCVSNGTSSDASVRESEKAAFEHDSPERKTGTGKSVNGADYETLGELIRATGEAQNRGGIVLLAGLEVQASPPVEVSSSANGDAADKIARACDYLVKEEASYELIYPPGYEILLETSVSGLSPAIQGLRASFALGAGTQMNNALALLTDTVGVTIVADNGIADAWCGELFLYDAPVSAIVEALLRSALIPPDAVQVESTDAYLFIRTAANISRTETCVNRAALSSEMNTMLASKVDVQIPLAVTGTHFQAKPTSLGGILDALSEQLGVSVTADPALVDFPVYQMKFIGMPMADVFNLIVRSWPVARYGYRVDDIGIRFVMNDQPRR